uniref:transglycosylase domain-containing protein n=1 Tax=Succinivibrio sp. TaxID=2053619 RepID=UPI00402A7DF9
MDKRNPRSLIYAMALLILCITGAIFVFVFTSINELSLSKFLDRSYVLYSDKGNVLAYTLSSDTSALRFKTTKDEVSKLYINMLIANEDKRFYSHFGVDPFSIVRAAFYNFRNQNVGSGASTLAMQVAKRLTGHKRTYINKVKEMVQAIYLTLKYKRDGILTLYLTLSPFGGNIEGVKAASLTWFNHLPNTLTPSEAALLTALPRAPEHIRPDKNPKSALYYKNEVLKLANRAFIITKEQLNLSLKEELPHKRFTIRQNALTFGNYVFNLKKSNTKTDFKGLDILHTDDKEIFSSLDDTVQDELNLIAAKFEQNSDPNYVLSAIVLDVKSHTIKGVLGSSSNKKTTVCLPFRLRSPGSSLKPFAYAFAMEKGMLHPNTILHDNQNLYGTWSPNNFSRKFCGNISAKKALTYSLNLPALEVLNLVGANCFSKKFNLNEQLLKIRNNKSDLSIVLGSGIINLYNLARLYAMLNEDGLMHEFTYKNKSDINLQKYRLLTKDSARAVFEILKETPRPYLYPEQKLISYKTGTAYEFTDALAIGSLNNLTVAVSISSPYNIKGNTHYTGYDSASPYLFEILSKSKTEKLYKEDLNSPLLNTAPPTALKELNLTNQSHALNHEKKLEITFPTNGQTVSPDSHGKVYIKTKGQTGELIITVNNEQFEQHYFEPKREGFYSITVIDEAGQTDTTKIKVEFR